MFLYEIYFIPVPTYIYIYLQIFKGFSEGNKCHHVHIFELFSRVKVIFLVPFGLVHPLYLQHGRIIAKVRKRKVVHASKTHLTRAVFLRVNRKNWLFIRRNVCPEK